MRLGSAGVSAGRAVALRALPLRALPWRALPWRALPWRVALLSALLLSAVSFGADRIVVGGKIFTEGYVLGEIGAQQIEASSQVPVIRKLGMGSTGILFEALKSGAIDVYPDYSGTLAEAILKRPELKSLDEIRQALSGLGLTISGSLGFNDTYALAVKEEFAKQHDLR